MKEKQLGRTGVYLPEIGWGTWNYKGGIEPLRRGIELGAFFIDTAESYGTEAIVGRAIRGMRNQVFVATKVSPVNFRRRDLLAAAQRSLKSLGIEYIDLYQLHRPNYTVALEETMAAMEDLVETGKVRFIGVSNFSADEIKRAQEALSKHRIASNQVRYNLVERTIDRDLLLYCQENGITVIAYSPLARGLNAIRRMDPKNLLSEVAATMGKTEAQVALNWCIGKEGVMAISTASSVAHIEENCGASGWQLPPEQIRLLDEGIKCGRRGRLESTLRRTARCVLQRLGYVQAFRP
jgi:diketogulonate reductase-like aldo/keto reductase